MRHNFYFICVKGWDLFNYTCNLVEEKIKSSYKKKKIEFSFIIIN